MKGALKKEHNLGRRAPPGSVAYCGGGVIKQYSIISQINRLKEEGRDSAADTQVWTLTSDKGAETIQSPQQMCWENQLSICKHYLLQIHRIHNIFSDHIYKI